MANLPHKRPSVLNKVLRMDKVFQSDASVG
jgi:hypothetical protein